MDVFFWWVALSDEHKKHAIECLSALQIRPEHQKTVLKDLLAFVEREHPGPGPWRYNGRMVEKIAKAWLKKGRGGRNFWGPWRDEWC